MFPDSTIAIPAIVGALSAAIGAVCGVRVARINKTPDVLAVTNQAISEIIKHYSEALHAATEEIKGLRREVAVLNAHVIELQLSLSSKGIVPPRHAVPA